ncbi:MAG: hypothetical protein MJK15_09790 [Colwellia sp.]|nr:hypothetical protein [Colwellia sp.]
MSDSTKLAKFIELFAVFLAAFSLVDFTLDLVRIDIGFTTVKSLGMRLYLFSYIYPLRSQSFSKLNLRFFYLNLHKEVQQNVQFTIHNILVNNILHCNSLYTFNYDAVNLIKKNGNDICYEI